MKFGVFYQLPCAAEQSVAGRYQDTLGQIRWADTLGFDTAWLAELHFNPRFSVMPAPLLVAASLAAVTDNIRLGTAVNLIPLHQPVRLAEEAATLDILSGGRALFGIGRGAMPSHYEGYGIDQAEGRDRFLEALELVLAAWTNDRFSYQGRYYQTPELTLAPRPLQQPHPPVYIAANSADTFGIIGELGHHILVAPTIVTTQGAVDGLAEYRRQLAQHGHEAAARTVSVTVHINVSENGRRAADGFETTINNYLGTLRDIGTSRGSQRAMTLTYEAVRDEFAAVGTPEEVADKLLLFRDRYQPQEIICWFNTGGMLPHSEVRQSMQLFAEKVMPRL